MWIIACCAVLGQDPDAFKDRKLDDRVEITFKGGHTLRGILVVPRGFEKEKYDLHKDPAVALDITMEYVRANGVVAFERQIVTAVTKLRGLSPAELSFLAEKKKDAQGKLKEEEVARLTKLDQRLQEETADREKAFVQKTSKEGPVKGDLPKGDLDALAVYRKFPEASGWGEDKYKELSKFLMASGQKSPKYLDVRVGLPILDGAKVPISRQFAPAKDDEAEFLDKFDLWKKGRDLFKAQNPEKPAEKPAEKPTDLPKKAESPAPEGPPI